MAAVVGVTAGLVNAPPARTEIAMHEPQQREVELGPLMAHVTVTPAMAGCHEIHLDFEGRRPDEVHVSVSLSAQELGPLAGDWTLSIQARRGEFELFANRISVPIEEES
jgi:hypothetical protein